MAVYDPPCQLLRENMLNIVNMYVRDHVVVTGDNHLILIAVGHPRVPGVRQLHKNCH